MQVVVFPVTRMLPMFDFLKTLHYLAEGRSRTVYGEHTQSAQRCKCGRACPRHCGFTWMMAIIPKSSWDNM